MDSISFKGYGNIPVKGLFVTDKNCADVLRRLSDKTGLDVFTPQVASKSIRKEIYELQQKSYLLWAQDYITFVKNKLDIVLFDVSRDHLKRILRGTADGIKHTLGFEPLKVPVHLRGGNFFICDNNSKREMLICENKMREIPEDFLKKIYNVEKVHPIPRLDYHLDLFVRPLNDGNVLVADYELTKDMLKSGTQKIRKHIDAGGVSGTEKSELEAVIEQLELYLQKFEITEKFAPYKHREIMPKIIDTLEKAGYNPIRVPGNYYSLEGIKDKAKEQSYIKNFENNIAGLRELAQNYNPAVQYVTDKYIELQTFIKKQDKNIGIELVNLYENNFLNAIVSEKDGKLVYITNAPLLDRSLGITPEIEAKVGFSTKKVFVDSVKDYIDEKNIHFVDEKTTNRLFNAYGGIHCSAAEII